LRLLSIFYGHFLHSQVGASRLRGFTLDVIDEFVHAILLDLEQVHFLGEVS